MTNLRQFKLPDVGEGLTEGEILQWLVAVGDTVTVNQPLCEVETAKAAVELPSPYAGTVTELHFEAGTMVGRIPAAGTPDIGRQGHVASGLDAVDQVLPGHGEAEQDRPFRVLDGHLGIQLLGRALVVGRLDQLVVPVIAALLHLAVALGRLHDDDRLERLEVAHLLVDGGLDRGGLALAARPVGADQRLRLGDLHPLLHRAR